jgi:hypothetical protein
VEPPFVGVPVVSQEGYDPVIVKAVALAAVTDTVCGAP